MPPAYGLVGRGPSKRVAKDSQMMGELQCRARLCGSPIKGLAWARVARLLPRAYLANRGGASPGRLAFPVIR